MQYSRLEMEWPAINFPEIYFKFFSNYLFISIPFFSFACIRTNTHEWNFFNRSLVGKLTEVIDEMGNIFVKITRVHESVIDTRERSNIGVLKVSGIERCDLYTWNKNPLTGESKFRIGSSNVYDVNERFWHVVEEIVGKKKRNKSLKLESKRVAKFFFPLFSLPSFDSIETMRVNASSSVDNTYRSFRHDLSSLARKHSFPQWSFSRFSIPVESGTPRAVNLNSVVKLGGKDVRGQLTLIWSAASSRLLRIDGPYSDRLKFQFSPCSCETTWSLQRTKKYIYKWDLKYSFVECLSNSIKILKSTKENHAHILLNIYFV